MFVPVFTLPTQLTKLKTELSFVAENPWTGFPRSNFTVDDYVVTLRGTKRLPETIPESRWHGGFHRALYSDAEGVTRFLPESLTELWLTGQVSTEALPRLLKQIEPKLRTSDYWPILRSLKLKIGVVLEAICCLALVIIALIAVVLDETPLWMAVAIVLATAAAGWAVLYLMYFGKLFRRKRQMRWLLDRIAAQSS